MTKTVSGQAHDRDNGLSVEVCPGGALRSLSLEPEALHLGRYGLATAILGLVRKASAQANQRARHALRDELGGLRPEEVDALGIAEDDELLEDVESTTPETWRA